MKVKLECNMSLAEIGCFLMHVQPCFEETNEVGIQITGIIEEVEQYFKELSQEEMFSAWLDEWHLHR